MANYNYTLHSSYSNSTTSGSSCYSTAWGLWPGQLILVYGDPYRVRHVEGNRIYFFETDNYLEILGGHFRWVEPNNDFETAPEEALMTLLGG